MYKQPLIGCDPELFVVNKQNRYVSAHAFLPGTKESPEMVDKGAVQVDGVAAEFNIAPADSADEFSENIHVVLQQLQSLIRLHDPNLRLRVSPTATFTRKYFKKLPPEVLRLGCEPDFDAYTNKSKHPPATTKPFRTGGGHIHVGWSEAEDVTDDHHVFDCIEVTQQLDCALYLPSLLWDNDDQRRQLYGQIGSFRPKVYGMEYRPLSNAWVADPDLHRWVFNTTRWAVKALDDGVSLYRSKELKQAVDTIRDGGRITKRQSQDLHLYMYEDLDCPKLPESYISVAA